MLTNLKHKKTGKEIRSCTKNPNNIIFIGSYNIILSQKCNVNASILFQKFNILFVYKFQFWSHILIHQVRTSLSRIGLLIGRVSVAILPLIMHFTTAIRFFPSSNGLKFAIIPVLKFALFLFGSYTKTMSPLLHVSRSFSFLYLKCSPSCSKYSLFQRFQKSTKI